MPVGVAVHASVSEERDDLGIGSNLQGLPHDGGDTQVEVHHHALHRQPPALFLFGRSFAWAGLSRPSVEVGQHAGYDFRRGGSNGCAKTVGRFLVSELKPCISMRWVLDWRACGCSGSARTAGSVSDL
ncbi:hypothetical protein D9M70_626220 [compost metagenome]